MVHKFLSSSTTCIFFACSSYTHIRLWFTSMCHALIQRERLNNQHEIANIWTFIFGVISNICSITLLQFCIQSSHYYVTDIFLSYNIIMFVYALNSLTEQNRTILVQFHVFVLSISYCQLHQPDDGKIGVFYEAWKAVLRSLMYTV
jgi:hypothetical protein